MNNSRLTVISSYTLIFSCLLTPLVSVEMSLVSLTAVEGNVSLFSGKHFHIFVLVFVFSIFIVKCSAIFFLFILFQVCQTSWICGLVSLINFWKFLTIMFSDIAPVPFSFPLLTQAPIICVFDLSSMYHMFLHSFMYFLIFFHSMLLTGCFLLISFLVH